MRIFRVARPGSPSWNVTKTLLQTAAFWTLFLYALPVAICAGERTLGVPGFAFTGQHAVGVVLFALCGALGLTSGVWMAVAGAGTPLPLDSARRLVVRGPHAILRNPMAIAGIGQGFAVGVMLGSWSVLAYALAGAVLWDRVVRRIEERELEERFGDAFREYRERVACWWPPTWPPYAGRATDR